MNDLFRKSVLPVMLLASTVLFSGCATQGKPPPTISLDEPVQAQPLPEPLPVVAPAQLIDQLLSGPALGRAPGLGQPRRTAHALGAAEMGVEDLAEEVRAKDMKPRTRKAIGEFTYRDSYGAALK